MNQNHHDNSSFNDEISIARSSIHKLTLNILCIHKDQFIFQAVQDRIFLKRF